MGPDAFVQHFSEALARVDAKAPIASNKRSKRQFHPGIGPHSESEVLSLVIADLRNRGAEYANAHLGVAYPASRQRCDLCFGSKGSWDWAYEIKLLRFLGDNGKPNDNMLMHILSPYAADRSAVTDCKKLVDSQLAKRNAVVIFGYETQAWPLEPALSAFETLARESVTLSRRFTGGPVELIHPVHDTGYVVGWEIRKRT